MTAKPMSDKPEKFDRVELTEEGLAAGVCRQRVGTVTGYTPYGNQIVVHPDGLMSAHIYPPSWWRKIPLHVLKRTARIPR